MSYTPYTSNPFSTSEKPLSSSKLNNNLNAIAQLMRSATAVDAASGLGGGAVFIHDVTTGLSSPKIGDSSQDWRDRFIYIAVWAKSDATPANYQPGGANDNAINGKINQGGGGDNFAVGGFYSRDGGTSIRLDLIADSGTGDQVQWYVDSGTGALKFRKSDDTGDEFAFGAVILYSPDLGQY